LMPGSSERTFVILAIDDTALNLAVVKAALGRSGCIASLS
jgi:siroheme synthase (precorrin-2 oxidase/ferrochelatase)